jgi:hypothetical protein
MLPWNLTVTFGRLKWPSVEPIDFRSDIETLSTVVFNRCYTKSFSLSNIDRLCSYMVLEVGQS